jgi:hypothetical protein
MDWEHRHLLLFFSLTPDPSKLHVLGAAESLDTALQHARIVCCPASYHISLRASFATIAYSQEWVRDALVGLLRLIFPAMKITAYGLCPRSVHSSTRIMWHPCCPVGPFRQTSGRMVASALFLLCFRRQYSLKRGPMKMKTSLNWLLSTLLPTQLLRILLLAAPGSLIHPLGQ